MTPEQSRAARGLKDWPQARLAEEAKVGLSTVRNFETGRSVPISNNLDAMRRALEKAGVIFVEENGEGPGVRLKKQKGGKAGDPEPTGPATDAVEAMDAAIENVRATKKPR